MGNKYFDKFKKTGKVEDYLKYREELAKEVALNEERKAKGNRTKEH
jgi:hypothetical protein